MKVVEYDSILDYLRSTKKYDRMLDTFEKIELKRKRIKKINKIKNIWKII